MTGAYGADEYLRFVEPGVAEQPLKVGVVRLGIENIHGEVHAFLGG